MATFSVQYIYTLVDRFSGMAPAMVAAANSIKGSAAAAGAAVVGLGTALAAAGAAVGLGAALMIGNSVKAAASFEAEMANVRRVADLTREQMMSYGKDALLISVATGNTAEDIAKIMSQGAAMGLRDQGILAAFSELTAKVAVAWDDMNRDQASRSLATITAQWFGGEDLNTAKQHITDLGDAMNELSNRSAFKAPELLKAFERGGVMAKQFGLTAEQFSAYAGTSLVVGEKSGELQGTRARMTFDKLMRNVARPTKASAWAMKQLGYTRQNLGKMILNNPQDAILDIMERTQGMDPIKRSSVIGGLLDARSAAQFLSVANNLNEYKRQLAIVDDKYAARFSKDKGFMDWLRGSNYADMVPMLEEYGRVITRAGSVEREFQKKSDTLSFAVKQREAAFRRLQILVGEPFLQPLTKLNAAITGVFNSMGNWAAGNQDLTKAVGFGALTAGIAGLGYFALSAIGSLTGLGGALAVLKAIGMVSLKLTLLAVGIATAYWLYDNWPKLKQLLADPLKVDILFPTLPDWLKGLLQVGAESIKDPGGIASRWQQGIDNMSKPWFQYDGAGTGATALSDLAMSAEVARRNAQAAFAMTPHQMLGMHQTPDTTWWQRNVGGASADWGAQPFNAASIPQAMAVDVVSRFEATFQPATITITGTVNGSVNGTGSLQANPSRGTSAATAGAPSAAGTGAR